MGEKQGGEAAGGESGGEQQGQEAPKAGEQAGKTFTQADIDRIVQERLAQQAKNQFGDYADLKAKADASKTLEQRLAEVEQKAKDAETSALRSDIATKHGISAEDRDLFLTGTDEATLTAQAKRLAEREADRKSKGNVAPREGASGNTGGSDEKKREFVRGLFGNAD